MGYLTVKKTKAERMNIIATTRSRRHKTLLPLVAIGGSLTAVPAGALELGELTVESRLGQPLRASIAYALAPNEQIADSCVSLRRGPSASGLPGVGQASLRIGEGSIVLTGQTPIREPMVAAQLVVDCPYTANFSREYMMFIDPPAPVSAQQPVAQQPVVQAAPAVVPAAAAPRAPARVPAVSRRTNAAVSREPIRPSGGYRVQPGETLSEIVQRIENRPIGLWPAVFAVFEANPDAFMDNDPNKLKAGSLLSIPSFDGSEAVVTAAPRSVPETATPAVSDVVEAAPVTIVPVDIMTPAAADPAAAAVAKTPAVEPAAAEAVDTVTDSTADLRPGDIILDGDAAFVESSGVAQETIVIPDTELAGPVTDASSPNVPTATIDTGSAPETSSSWLFWLAGSGLAILIALLLFGRRIRNLFGAADAQPMRRATDGDTAELQAALPIEEELSDDSPTEENLALDADLIVGTGLEEGTDMEVAQDFGFASPTEVDIELPFEPQPTEETQQTDIIAPVRADEHSILDSEVLPDDDDYDMSVIVDATKMPHPEDVTERDLKAVEVSADEDDTATTDSYTINEEASFNVLEQDYEDQLTATQALKLEIARVAAELSNQMDEDTVETGLLDEPTAEMPLATVTELDVTAQLPTRETELSDLDDTGVNEAITVNITRDENTVEIQTADNDDDTTEMEIEGGKVDTKAL